MTAAHVLAWAGFVGCTLATAALSARSLRDGLPQRREAQARLREARAVRAQLRAWRMEFESWLDQQAPPSAADGNGENARERIG